MQKLIKKGYDPKNTVLYGNMFLLGNGHLGYRGTLEEDSKEQLCGLNICGCYDQYQDQWRESVNVPIPFFVRVSCKEKVYSVLEQEAKSHQVCLDLHRAIFSRKSDFQDIVISSERFIAQGEENTILMKYRIYFRKGKKIQVTLGMDKEIYEINGPHFKETLYQNQKKKIIFHGITNEGKVIKEEVNYFFQAKSYHFSDGRFTLEVDGKKGQTYEITAISRIFEHGEEKGNTFLKKDYARIKKEHVALFQKKWEMADIEVSSKRAQFAMRYSIYHLLILGNDRYDHSIPARGVSGQTYKGAIFWDTEIFMIPYFTLTFPSIAKSLLHYRIRTLPGALQKAKEYGYDGAFFAWESQETGEERCSKYNVTDPVTHHPIRTYFNEKQIHISADIVYALCHYMEVTKDVSLLQIGGISLMEEVARFYISYATKRDGQYHFDDVIGPDEYHERVHDNAFTNYMIHYAFQKCLQYGKDEDLKEKCQQFLDEMFLPLVDETGIIEQFAGYHRLEDTTVDIVRSRLKHPQEYWGTKDGVAFPTRIIKQADVIALLVLLQEQFDIQTCQKNFAYYYPYTEHGSSLSSSMYSILASRIGNSQIAYEMFLKSAEIDLQMEQKLFAGGIYIGGTHPASNAGAYLSLIFGMVGLHVLEDGFTISPHLPKQIRWVRFQFLYQGKKYRVEVQQQSYQIQEVAS